MAYNPSYGVVQVKKAGTSTYVTIPLKLIAYESYKCTRNMLDLDSYRTETGVLWRNALAHRATKIEFETPYITATDWMTIRNIITDGYTDSTARKLELRYYNTETDSYSTGTFYRPDIEFNIRNVDGTTVNYNGIRIAFIEY